MIIIVGLTWFDICSRISCTTHKSLNQDQIYADTAHLLSPYQFKEFQQSESSSLADRPNNKFEIKTESLGLG